MKFEEENPHYENLDEYQTKVYDKIRTFSVDRSFNLVLTTLDIKSDTKHKLIAENALKHTTKADKNNI